jgi:hypothetical protein
MQTGETVRSAMVVPLLDDVSIEGNLISYRLAPQLRSIHASGPLWVRYPPDVDLAAIPEEIRLLPAAYFFAPLAWAFDRHFSLPLLEKRAAAALDEIRGYFRRVYPGLSWSGSIRGERTTSAPGSMRGDFDAAALFTGGVDSTYTVLSRGAERLLLLNVWESRTGSRSPNRSYQEWLAEAGSVMAQLGHQLVSVQTNGWQVMDRERVARELSSRQRIFNWWADVHFGMALAGTVAPVLHRHGITQMYIAGGSVAERTQAEGLAPDDAIPEYASAASPHVDNRIVLGAAQVEHHAPATRQQKLDAIVADERLPSAGPLVLRVCLLAPYDSAVNCGACEKCLRTISGIVVAGGDELTVVHTANQTAVGLPLRVARATGDEEPSAREVEHLDRFSAERAAFERHAFHPALLPIPSFSSAAAPSRPFRSHPRSAACPP